MMGMTCCGVEMDYDMATNDFGKGQAILFMQIQCNITNILSILFYNIYCMVLYKRYFHIISQ
jgi:hypothetical protein